MNLTEGIHVWQVEVYAVWEKAVDIRYRGVVAVVWRDDAGWQVEGIINFGPNVATFLMTSRSWRWYIVGAYVPPNDASDVYRKNRHWRWQSGYNTVMETKRKVEGTARSQGGKDRDDAVEQRAS